MRNDLKSSEFPALGFAKAGAGLLVGAGIGAGIMYLFDPDRGRARRARLQDQAGSLWRHAGQKAEKVAQDVANRCEGLAAVTKRAFDHAPVDPPILVARVRTKLGRVIRKPHDVTVAATDAGIVTLSGNVDANDAGKLLTAVMTVPGVHDVRNEMTLRAEKSEGVMRGASAIASLAGGLLTVAGIRALKRAG
jgi:osmotically-inducible protein OsmY